MKCPSCKNPINPSSVQCEWCDAILSPSANQRNLPIDDENNAGSIQLFIKWSSSYLAFVKINVTVDDVEIGQGQHNKDFEFSCITNNNRPSIVFTVIPLLNVFNIKPKNVKIFLPDQIFLELNSAYVIHVKPKSLSGLIGFVVRKDGVIKLN